MGEKRKERLIDELVKSLDAEQELKARSMLDHSIDSEHPNLEKTTDRLQSKKPGKIAYGRAVLVVLLVVSFMTIIFSKAISPMRWIEVYDAVITLSFDTDSLDEIDFTDEETLFLESSESVSNAKLLMDSDSENIAYIANYIAMVLEDDSLPIPVTAIARAEAMDPDNALYSMSVVARARDAIKTSSSASAHQNRLANLKEINEPTKKERKELATLESAVPTYRTYDIVNQAKYEEAIHYLEKALSKGTYKQVRHDFHKKEMEILMAAIPPYDLRSSIVFNIHNGSYISRQLILISQLFAAHIDRICETKDREAVEWWINQYLDYLYRLSENPLRPLGSLILRSEMKRSVNSMLRASMMVGWDEMTNKLTDYKHALNEVENGLVSNIESLNSDKYSLMYKTAFFHRAKVSEDIWTDEELVPARYIEHAFLGKTSTICIWLILGVLLCGLFVFKLKHDKVMNILSLRFCDAIVMKDWCFIIGFGVLAPMILSWLMLHYTSFSIREVPIELDSGLPSLLFYTALCLSIIGMSLSAIRYRISGILPFKMKKVERHVLVINGMSLMGMVLVGCFVRDYALYCIIWLGIPLIYWIIRGCVAFLRSIWSQYFTINRVMIPVIGVAMLSMNIMAFAFHQQEKYWFEQDVLIKFDLELGVAEFEARMAKQHGKESRALLELLK